MAILDDFGAAERAKEQKEKRLGRILLVVSVVNICSGILYFLSLINKSSETQLVKYSYYLIPFLVFNLVLPSRAPLKIASATIASIVLLWLFYTFLWGAL